MHPGQGRSVRESRRKAASPAVEPAPAAGRPRRQRARRRRSTDARTAHAAAGVPAHACAGRQPADGVLEFGRIIGSGQVRKWPMYLRNVKQIIKSGESAFDERAYGFANLVELLRAAQRDGLVRVDRDRHGVIRIFQGSNAPAGAVVAAAPAAPTSKIFDIEDELAAEAAMARRRIAPRKARSKWRPRPRPSACRSRCRSRAMTMKI